MKKKMSWQKETLKLRDRHYWTAQPGCQVFVADRGAVRLAPCVASLLPPGLGGRSRLGQHQHARQAAAGR